MTPLSNVVHALESAGCDPRPTGQNAYESKCPAHRGDKRNLSIREGDDGRVLLNCHGRKCAPDAVVEALGLTMADLFPESNRTLPRPAKPSNGKRPREFATVDDAIAALTARGKFVDGGRWPYVNEAGEEIAYVVRLNPVDPAESKQFRPVSRVGDGWRIGDPPGKWPLFKLGELVASVGPPDVAYVCEGERCADVLRRLGYVATTSAHGAKSAHKSDWSPLGRFRLVTIWPDHDEPGQAYARDVARELKQLPNPPEVRVLDPASLAWDGAPPRGWDAVDWFAEAPSKDPRVLWERLETALASARVLQTDEEPAPDVVDELDGEPEDGWPALRVGELPAAPEFPRDALPLVVREFAERVAEAVGCAIDFPALACLAVAGGAIGRSLSLRVKDRHPATAALFVVLVSPPSDGKSPCLSAVAEPLERIERQFRVEYERESDAFDRDRKTSSDKSDKPPTSRRLIIDDATTERLVSLLQQNPRGLIVVKDELASLFAGMNQYKAGGKGSDRQFYLTVWSGKPVTRDRVKLTDGDSVHVANPFLAIIGGITPACLTDMVDQRGRVDGFVDRFVFAYPDPMPWPAWSDNGIDESTAGAWRDVIDRLHSRTMRMTPEGEDLPNVVEFSPDGKSTFVRRFNAHVAEANDPAFDAELRGPWGKFRELAARLALILAALDRACDPTARVDAPLTVDFLAAEAAWRVTDYLKAMTRRVHSAMRGGGLKGPARVAWDWVRAERKTEFTRRELRHARRGLSEDDLTAATTVLESLGAIRKAPDPSRDGPGRPPSPTYQVNPLAHAK